MEENDHRNYFIINLQESMGLGRDQTRDPWICSQTHLLPDMLPTALRGRVQNNMGFDTRKPDFVVFEQ